MLRGFLGERAEEEGEYDQDILCACMKLQNNKITLGISSHFLMVTKSQIRCLHVHPL